MKRLIFFHILKLVCLRTRSLRFTMDGCRSLQALQLQIVPVHLLSLAQRIRYPIPRPPRPCRGMTLPRVVLSALLAAATPVLALETGCPLEYAGTNVENCATSCTYNTTTVLPELPDGTPTWRYGATCACGFDGVIIVGAPALQMRAVVKETAP